MNIPNELLARIIAALLAVESNPSNPDKRGDHGLAIGPLQIHRGVVEDVNRINGTHLRHEECGDLRVSKIVCGLYLQHHVPGLLGDVTPRKHSRQAIVRMAAAVWHEGPAFAVNPKDRDYIDRIANLVEASVNSVVKK